MESQKRRRNRVQGSWANQPRARGTCKTPDTAGATRNALRTEFTHTRDAEPSSPSSSNSAIDCNYKDGRLFVFEQEVAKSVKLAPPEQVIRCEGTYDISKDPSGISRLEFYPSFLTSEETEWMFEQLHKEIPWQAKSIKIKGEYHRQPRLTAWFGDFSYMYSGLLLKPFQWSPLLDLLREKIFTKTGEAFNSMLANLYRNEKDSVDWHCDDEPSLGRQPTIASLSLGEMRNFELRKKPLQGDDYTTVERIRVPLTSGSLLIMRGATQLDWQHRVGKEYHDRGPRINLTFRNVQPV